jgi:hypothetical protein
MIVLPLQNDEVGNIMEDAGFFKLELKTHN